MSWLSFDQTRKPLSAIFVILAMIVLFRPLVPAALAQQKSIDPKTFPSQDTVPARGRQEVILTVKEFGRYAITVSSSQGVAIQLISHMTGPGEINGKAGKTDGRLDVFLDQGEYKLVTYAHAKGQGSARLAAHPFC